MKRLRIDSVEGIGQDQWFQVGAVVECAFPDMSETGAQ